jgi:hypothetical protein
MQLKQYFQELVRPFSRINALFAKQTLGLLGMHSAGKNMSSRGCVNLVKIQYGGREMIVPNYKAVFPDFDYNYIELGEQLGEGWVNYTWRNDTSPRFSKCMDKELDVWYDVWFDYKDINLSEHSVNRETGVMHLFMLCDDMGDTILSTDNWEELRKAIVEDKLDVKHFDNAQEERATDTDD